MELKGLLCAFGAAIAFGVQYTPVKKYEIFDGTTFQWFMCSGIMMVGFWVALITGDLEAGCPREIVLGGALWALSNYFVLPLVKLLGIGLGFSLYHFVNLVVGYLVGRLGLFGVPVMTGNLLMCDVGCGLILASFVVMTFVENDEKPKDLRAHVSSSPGRFANTSEEAIAISEAGNDEAFWGNPAAEYRAVYRHWRMAGVGLNRSESQAGLESLLNTHPNSCLDVEYRSAGGFSAAQGDILGSIPNPHGLSAGTYLPPVPTVAAAAAANAQSRAATSLCVPLGEDRPQEEDQPRRASSSSAPGLLMGGDEKKAADPSGKDVEVGQSPRSPTEGRGERPRATDDARAEAPRLPAPAEPRARRRASMAAKLGSRFTGVLLALAGGGFCGVQSVPATLYNAAHPNARPSAAVFPQCLGIWAASSTIYVIYAALAKVGGWRVPHSAIRPAYLSGCIWAIGFLLMISGIKELGYSVGYSLDAAGPIMVSSLLSLLVFREITGKLQIALYFLGFSLQLAGVVLIAVFGGS